MPAEDRQRRVIAIAAPVGGGKSALVTALAQALGESATLRFDDYESATSQPIERLAAWLADGADFAKLQAPGLAADLAILRTGGAIIERSSGRTLSATRELVFEMPLGRAWPATAGGIDVLVWVDVPLDIALARRVREIAGDLQRQDPVHAQRGLAWLGGYLGHYIDTIHAVLETQRRVVRPQADLIVDGQADIASVVGHVLEHLGRPA